MATLETIEALMEAQHKQYRIDQKETKITLGEIVKQARLTNNNVSKNTAFKNKIKGGMIVVSSLGVVSTIVSIIALFKVNQ